MTRSQWDILRKRRVLEYAKRRGAHEYECGCLRHRPGEAHRQTEPGDEPCDGGQRAPGRRTHREKRPEQRTYANAAQVAKLQSSSVTGCSQAIGGSQAYRRRAGPVRPACRQPGPEAC